MKRIVLSAFLVLGMTVPMATPAQAIFGLSTCEKVKKKILAEEAIGRESWKAFDFQRDAYSKDKQMTNSEVMYLFKLVNLVHKSDLIIYSIASENTKCFSAQKNALIRSSQDETKRTYDVIVKGLRNYNTYNAKKLNIEGYDFLATYYSKFISVYDVK